MTNKLISGVLFICSIAITFHVVEFFMNKKELYELRAEKTKLSIELLKIQIKENTGQLHRPKGVGL